MNYLLDTNHCSYIINGDSQIIDALNSHLDSVIGISIITYSELLYMTEKSEKIVQNRIAVESFLTDVDLYLIDEETAII
jgi:tRNA(fMet)-specific endonuclease VapC